MFAYNRSEHNLVAAYPLPEHTRELLPFRRRPNAHLIEFRTGHRGYAWRGMSPQHQETAKHHALVAGRKGWVDRPL